MKLKIYDIQKNKMFQIYEIQNLGNWQICEIQKCVKLTNVWYSKIYEMQSMKFKNLWNSNFNEIQKSEKSKV